MPDYKTFDALAQGHGVGLAVLIVACVLLVGAVIALWRQNQALYFRIEILLQERTAALQRMLEGGRSDGRHDGNR